jgi:hypothetical protein
LTGAQSFARKLPSGIRLEPSSACVHFLGIAFALQIAIDRRFQTTGCEAMRMTRAATKQGLIVATNRQATSALEELIAYCDWPVLLHASPQRLRHQMLLGAPRVALSWLDDESDVPAAIQLLTWLRTYENAVRRIVMAYRLPTDVEVAVRGAGTHLYLATDDNVSALVDAWMPCWQRIEGRQKPALRPSAVDSPDGLPTTSNANLFTNAVPEPSRGPPRAVNR